MLNSFRLNCKNVQSMGALGKYKSCGSANNSGLPCTSDLGLDWQVCRAIYLSLFATGSAQPVGEKVCFKFFLVGLTAKE